MPTNPTVTLNSDKPTISGWYWYKETGKNLDAPLLVWVFETSKVFLCLSVWTA